MCICGDGFYLRFLLSCFVSLALRASVAALLASSFELFDILTTHQFNYDSTRLVERARPVRVALFYFVYSYSFALCHSPRPLLLKQRLR